MKNEFMKVALEEAYYGIEHGHGGPFGAVIVKDGVIIGRGHNCVIKEKDPTLHGEMVAIKDACHHLNSFDLKGTQIYTTAEPCPMCLGAILWAGIEEIYYGCSRVDTENIGFRDNVFYQIMDKENKTINIVEIDKEKCIKLFEVYKSIENKKIY
jgi:tRNA(Arg) A34 adenosine deaminase TadA